METDKELLELAAKAADMDVEYTEGWGFLHCFNDDDKVWNPLTDDGDALRLAVKLMLDICCHESGAYVDGDRHEYSANEKDPSNPYAATRRAIVRAAAEIGKTL